MKKTKQNIIMEAVICHVVSTTLPFSKQLYLQMFLVISHWSGIASYCPMSWRSCNSGSAGLFSASSFALAFL